MVTTVTKEWYKRIRSSLQRHHSFLYYSGKNDLYSSPKELTLPASPTAPSSLSVPPTALMNDSLGYFLCFWYGISSLPLSLSGQGTLPFSFFLILAAHYHGIHWSSWFPLQLWSGCDFQTLLISFIPSLEITLLWWAHNLPLLTLTSCVMLSQPCLQHGTQRKW